MRPLLQAKDVAGLLKCSESHVYDLDKRGLLPCSVAWPRHSKGKDTRLMRRWTEEDVETFIENHRNGGNNE